jgi:ferredoxin--NADP+ reductase
MKTYRVLEIEHLTEKTFRLRTERPQVPIRAGQCFNVGLPGSGVNREYSMYSGAEAPYLEFLIRAVDGGSVSVGLQQLLAGSHVEIDGPYGEFCLQGPIDRSQEYLFIASGTGIAPFRSFVKSYPDLNYRIVHGVRERAEAYGAVEYLNDCYVPCISTGEAGHPGMRVTDYLQKNPVNPESFVYLCGNRNMIIDSFEILRDQGVPGDNLFTEVFF